MAFKRVLSVFLIFIIIFVQMPGSVYAQSGNKSKSISSDNGLVSESGKLLEGGIRINKTTTKLESPNEYNVKLEVETSPRLQQEKTNILFLMDISNEQIMLKNLEFIKKAIDEIYSENKSAEIAVMSMAGEVEIVSDFKGVQGKAELMQQLQNVSSSSGNYMDKAIRLAAQKLETRLPENCLLVVLSEGTATFSTVVQSCEAKVYCENHDTAESTKWIVTPSYRGDMQRVGTGTSLTAGLRGNQQRLPNVECNLGSLHRRDDLDYPYHHGETAIYEGQKSRESGIDVLSVMLIDSTGVRKEIMSKIQNKGLYSSVDTGIAGIRNTFNSTVQPAYEDAYITKEFPSYLSVKPQSAKADTGELEIKPSGLVWKLDENSKILEYTVIIDVQSAEFPDAEMNICELSKFSSSSDEFSIAQTPVAGEYSEIFVQPRLVNSAGEYIDENGNPTNAEQAVKLAEPRAYPNPNGVNRWQPGSRITVNCNSIALQDYILHPTAQSEYIVELKSEAASPIVCFPYMSSSVNYTVEHYINGESTPFDNTVNTAKIGEIISEVVDSPHTPKGYARLAGDQFPFRITGEQDIIKIYYDLDKSQTISYTIKYYLENKFLEHEQNEVYLGNSKLKIVPEHDRYTNYQLEKIVFYDTEHPQQLEVEITEDKNLVEVYYIADPGKTFEYQLQYYQDLKLVETEKKSVSKANPFVEISAENDRYEGFIFDKITFYQTESDSSLNIEITETRNVVKVHYKPDKQSWIDYEINYYIDDVLEETEQHSLKQGEHLNLSVDTERYAGKLYEGLVFYDEKYDESTTEFSLDISEQKNKIGIYYRSEVLEPEEKFFDFVLEYYLEGDLIKTEPKRVSEDFPDYKFAPELYWEEQQSYILTKVSFGNDGEHLAENTDSRYLKRQVTETENVFRAYYQHPLYNIETNYYYDGELYSTKKHNITIRHGDVLSEDHIRDFAYKYERGDPFTIPALGEPVTDPSPIEVHYVSGELTILDYKINYYQNGVLAFSEDKQVYGKNPIVTLSREKLKERYAENGYSLQKIEFMKVEKDTGKISLWQNEFCVYYTKEIPAEQNYIFNVEHHYDGVLEHSEQLEIPLDKIMITENDLILKEKENFKLEKVEPRLPITIELEKNLTIKLFYKEKTVEIKPGANKTQVKVIFPLPNNIEITDNALMDVPLNKSISPWTTFYAYATAQKGMKLDKIIIIETPMEDEEPEENEPNRAALNLGNSGVSLGDSNRADSQDGDINRAYLASATAENANIIKERASYYVGLEDRFVFKPGYSYEVYFSYAKDDSGNQGSGGNPQNPDSSGSGSSGGYTLGKEKKDEKVATKPQQRLDKDSSFKKIELAPAQPMTFVDIADTDDDQQKRKELGLPKTGAPLMSFKVPAILFLLSFLAAIPSFIRKLFKK